MRPNVRYAENWSAPVSDRSWPTEDSQQFRSMLTSPLAALLDKALVP